MIQYPSKHFMRAELNFWIQRNHHDWKDTPQMHCHDFVELVYVVRGEARHVFEGSAFNISPGDVFIINPGEAHTYSIDPGNELEIINCLFLPDLIEESLLHELKISKSMDFFYVHPFLNKNERFHHRLTLNGQEAARVLALLEEMIGEIAVAQSGYSMIIRLRLLELLILLSRSQCRPAVQECRRRNACSQNPGLFGEKLPSKNYTRFPGRDVQYQHSSTEPSVQTRKRFQCL